MEIKIQLKGNKVLCICVGHVTRWFQQIHFITAMVEYYDDSMNVQWADWKFGLFAEKEK